MDLTKRLNCRDGNTCCFETLAEIGGGGFGTVFMIRVSSSDIPSLQKYENDNVALKSLILPPTPAVRSRQASKNNRRLEKDLEILVRLKHKNLARYLAVGDLGPAGATGVQSNVNRTGVLMKYYSGGTLYDMARGSMTELASLQYITLEYLYQLVSGLEYMHTLLKPIVHGDLKGKNIVLTSDKRRVKIADNENYTLLVDGKTPISGLCIKEGSEPFMSPEMFRYIAREAGYKLKRPVKNAGAALLDESDAYDKRTGIGRKTDIFSAGCVALELMGQGEVRYHLPGGKLIAPDKLKGKRTTNQGCYPSLASAESKISCQDFREVIKWCVKDDPVQRPSATVLKDRLTVLRDANLTNIDNALKELAIHSIDEPIPNATGDPTFVSYQDYGTKEFTFQWISILGRGAYGEVYVIAPRIPVTKSAGQRSNPLQNILSDSVHFALKIVDHGDIAVATGSRLTTLDHPNVAKHIAFGLVSHGPGNIAYRRQRHGILMEYYTGGNLNCLAQQKDLSAETILGFTLQIASGLAYLHERKLPIVHGDLKGANIFLTSEQPVSLKIGDLENHAFLVSGRTNASGLHIREGTLTHMSPEMLAYACQHGDLDGAMYGVNTKIGRATDIWSLGCVVLEMFGGGAMSYVHLDGQKAKNKHFSYRLFNLQRVHPDTSVVEAKVVNTSIRLQVLDILHKCLQREPRERPTASELVSEFSRLCSHVCP